jgi:hypothetical protein
MALESLQKGVNGTEGPSQETVVIHYFSQRLIRFRVSSIIPVMGDGFVGTDAPTLPLDNRNRPVA